MRICSLVPGATEVVAMLGLTEHLVGISHECDYPPSVRQAPVIVEPVIDHEVMESAAIDRRIKALVSSNQPLYRLDVRAFVDSRPDTILTQDLCHVCAVTPDQLSQAIQSLASPPRLMTLNPASLFDVLDDVERIGAFLGEPARGRELAGSLRTRVLATRTKSGETKARVLCLEWLSPLYIGGHWVPEMVNLAGGEDVLGQIGRPSRQVTWDEVHAASPDIVVMMPCGFSVAHTASELSALCRTDEKWLRVLRSWPKIYVVDASSYFSRPGPRLVDGLELLTSIFSGNLPPDCDHAIAREITASHILASESR